MAGHSHSANIFYKKSAVDAKRGKMFSKIARMIMSAVRQNGPDIDGNSKLRLAIEKARAVSMPKDNIERAIKRGTGDLEGISFEEILYEGYAAGGVAVMVEVITDNKHRTAPELRKVFETHGGNLGASGSVAWMFERKAVLRVPKEGGPSEEKLLDVVLEMGADDLINAGDAFEVRAEATSLHQHKAELEKRKIPVQSAEVLWVPKNLVSVADPDNARRVISLVQALDDHDDVQSVYASYDIPEEILTAVAAEGKK